MRLLPGLRSNVFVGVLVLALGAPLFAQTATPPAPAVASQPNTVSSAAPPTDPKSADAKQADPNDEDPVATIKTQVREVNVIFTVTDKHGRFKKDLKQEDLHILDDGKA